MKTAIHPPRTPVTAGSNGTAAAMLLVTVPILGCGNDAGVGSDASTTANSSSTSFPSGDTSGLAGTNNDVLTFDPAWLPNIAMSDFHVAAGSPFADVAEWQDGDPPTDIDGDLRPTVGGTADYAGADVP